jgi:hypothetical protein
VRAEGLLHACISSNTLAIPMGLVGWLVDWLIDWFIKKLHSS